MEALERAHRREAVQSGEFEVLVTRDGEELGRLNRTFDTEYGAGQAAYDTEIPDVGIEAEVQAVSQETPDEY